MHLFSWWYLEEAKQWCGYQIKVVFRCPLLQILSNANIHQCFAIKVMRNLIVYRVIRYLCSSMEGSSNPPKLRRNSSAAANISNLASSSNQGYHMHLSKDN